MSHTDTCQLKLVSGDYRRRVGLYPMAAALALGWIFVALWLAVAIMVFQYNPLWSIVLSMSTVVFAVYVGIMSWRLFGDAFKHYTFELTESEAVLVVVDRLRHTRSTQMVLFDDVTFAEYYPFQDSASVILHAPYARMEVPLWPIGPRSSDVIDFLRGRGVRVVDVQSDDCLPPD